MKAFLIVVAVAGGITALTTAAYSVARVCRTLGHWFRAAVRDATTDLHEDVREATRLADVRHAENVGRFDSLHERVCVVEADLKEHMKDAAQDRARYQGDGK